MDKFIGGYDEGAADIEAKCFEQVMNKSFNDFMCFSYNREIEGHLENMLDMIRSIPMSEFVELFKGKVVHAKNESAELEAMLEREAQAMQEDEDNYVA